MTWHIWIMATLFSTASSGSVLPEADLGPTLSWGDRCGSDSCIQISYRDGKTDVIGANKVSERIYKGNVASTQSEAVIIYLEDVNSRIVVLISSPTNGLCNLLVAEMNGTGKPMCL